MDASAITSERQAPPQRRQIVSRILLGVLIFAAGSEFIVRGPIRFLNQSSDWNDLVPVYIPARAWLHGQNPYDPNVYTAQVMDLFHKPWNPAAPRSHAVYPLSTFVWISPLAALPWGLAQPVWTLTLVALIAAMIISMIRAAGLESERAWIFAACTLALAPLHTGLATGNISMAAAALAGLLFCEMHAGHKWAAGICLAAIVGLKPQIGLPLLIYYAFRSFWLPCGIATGGTLLSFAIGALRLSRLGTVWTYDFFRNTRVFVGSNLFDDFSQRNPIRFTLIDLQVPFSYLVQDRTLTIVVALAVTLTVAILWLVLFRKERNHDDLLNISTIAILSLLPVYHRFYDASLLVLPLCWTICTHSTALAHLRRICWVLMVPFLIPGASLLQQVSSEGLLARYVVNSWYWNFFVMPHETWALLALVVTLLRAMRRRIREQASLPEIPVFSREVAN